MPDTGELVEVIDQKAAAPLLKERGVGMPGTQGSDTERDRRAQVKRESAFRWKLFEAIRQKSPATLARQDLEQVALMGFARHGFDARKRLLKVWEWDPKKGKGYDGLHHDEAARSRIPKLSDAELARFLLDCVDVNDLQVSAWSTDQAERLTGAAQRLRINVEAIRKEFAPEATPKKGNTLKASAISKPAVRAARRQGRKSA